MGRFKESDGPRKLGHIAKRVVDSAVSAGAIVILAPVLGGAALSVWARMGRPVFFQQIRPGKDGRPFRVYKFRTMSSATSLYGQPLPDSERLTPLGVMLRRWSIDELPELWNVLKGDMSLVGPRPLLMEYLGLYDETQTRRHEVRPGLTGLAQVSGRNNQSWEVRLALDVWYVDHWSPWLDVRILGRTVANVITGDGISAAGEATMQRFKGSAHG